MKLKKLLALIMTFYMVFLSAVSVAAKENGYEIESKQITVTYNGENVDFLDVFPVISNGRTMVPLRAIFERMGCEVAFDSGKITAVRGDEKLFLEIGNSLANAERKDESGEVVTEKYVLEAPPFIQNERTLVPVRFIAEALGCKINWSPYLREAVIIDVRAWKDEIREVAPIVDALLSMPIAGHKANTLKNSGTFDFKLSLQDMKDENGKAIPDAEIKFSLKLNGTTLSVGGKKRFNYTIGVNFSGLKSYANTVPDAELKGSLRRLSELSSINLNAVLDEEYNLYLNSESFSKLLSILGHSAKSVQAEAKALKIPVGMLLSDLSGLPLGTILRNGSVWEGIEKAVEEDNTMFTQTVKTLNDSLMLLKDMHVAGTTKMQEGKGGDAAYHFKNNAQEQPCEWSLTLKNGEFSKISCKETICVVPEMAGKTGALSLKGTAEFTSIAAGAQASQIAAPSNVMQWEEFLASKAGKSLRSLFE